MLVQVRMTADAYDAYIRCARRASKIAKKNIAVRSVLRHIVELHAPDMSS